MTPPGDSPAEGVAPSFPSRIGMAGTGLLSDLRRAAPWLDRVGSLIAAAFLLATSYFWWGRARDLFNPCEAEELPSTVCSNPPEFLLNLQFGLAVAGITVSVLLAALALYQGVSGRRAPWLRTVAAVLAVIALAWGAVYVIGKFFF